MSELLLTKQASELLNIKETTLEQWRWNGKGPKFIKMGRSVRYRKEDLDAFIEARIFESTEAAK